MFLFVFLFFNGKIHMRRIYLLKIIAFISISTSMQPEEYSITEKDLAGRENLILIQFKTEVVNSLGKTVKEKHFLSYSLSAPLKSYGVYQ